MSFINRLIISAVVFGIIGCVASYLFYKQSYLSSSFTDLFTTYEKRNWGSYDEKVAEYMPEFQSEMMNNINLPALRTKVLLWTMRSMILGVVVASFGKKRTATKAEKKEDETVDYDYNEVYPDNSETEYRDLDKNSKAP